MHLPFDDRSGAKAYDRSTKSNHGALNGPSWVAGRRGSALSFDGVNDYVSVTRQPILEPSAALTLALWIYATKQDARQRLIAKWNATVSGFDLHLWDSNDVEFYFLVAGVGYGYVVSSYASYFNAWHHLAVTYDFAGVGSKLYINGIQVNSSSQTVTPAYTNVDLTIGNVFSDHHFGGRLSDVRMYNRALTAAEIKRLFESEILLARH